MRLLASIACAAVLSAPLMGATGAPADVRQLLNGVGIQQNLNAPVPLDTVFLDENGASVMLRAYFGAKPVIFLPVYYKCPLLCPQIVSGVVSALRPLSLRPGRDFEVVAVSFNPADQPQDAREKRDHFARSYSSRAGIAGWHFLTGSQKSIDAVMKAVGFRYRYDPQNKMYVHASGIMVLTPEGRVARYLYGVEFEPKDLKLSLVEASHHQIGSPVDEVLLYCYHYDPKTGKYGAVVVNLLKLAGALTLAIMASGLFWLWRRDIRFHNRVWKEARRT